jgi:hypothetical protein
LVAQAVKDLGVKVETRAERYKLLLYEEGAFFKAHRDTEKVPGMFGTLVICLPSYHSGGEVFLEHNNKKHTIKTAGDSAWNLSTLAWYSDVSHEIRPVTLGHRLVLTYNLVQDQSTPEQTASALDVSHEKFESLLQLWNDQFTHIAKLIYPLEHQYTPASLSLEKLKGHDAAKAQILEQSCFKKGIMWFLGRMTKSTNETYDGEIAEEGAHVLDDFVTSTGQSISMLLDEVVDGEVLVDMEDLYGGGPDSEDEGSFTGNETMPSQYRYHNAVSSLISGLLLFY